MAEALSKRGAKVTGADPSEAAIAAAGCHAEANDLEIAVCSNFCRIGRLLLGPPQRAERSALPGDPADQAGGIQQRCCLIEELLDGESYLKTLLMKARTGAGIGGASYSRGLIKPVTDLS